MADKDHLDAARHLISNSSELASGAAAGALGFLAAGPAGAAAFGVAGVAVSKMIGFIGQEVSDRLLSSREKQRVGGVMAIAAADIQQRLEKGENLRADGFFENGQHGRSDTDEVAENIILKAQRDPEEKKLKYMAYLLSNTAFDYAISPQMAHQITKSSERMTYRQLCLLKIYGIDQIRNELRNKDYREQGAFAIELRQVLYESFDLARSYYITSESYILGVTDICPRQTQTQGVGADMYNFMRLREIPMEDLRPIIHQLT